MANLRSVAKEYDYKIVLIGDAGTGKSAYISRLLGKPFSPAYRETRSVDVRLLTVATNRGDFRLSVWDTSGADRNSFNEAYYINANAGLIFCDFGSRTSARSMTQHAKNFQRVRDGFPMVFVANKSDIPEPKFKATNPISISVKTGSRHWEPIAQVLRQLTGDPNLEVLSF